MLLSVFVAPGANWSVRAALAGCGLLAIARPDAALLVTIALPGFGVILSHLGGVPPLRVTELLVATSLAGCCLRAALQRTFRRSLTAGISAPVVLLAIAAAASTLVWLRVDQFQTGYASDYFEAFVRFARRDYFVQPGRFWLVVTTAVILEGLALYVIVAGLCRLERTFFDRSLRMLVIGGAGLAVMSVVRLAEILLRNPGAIEALRAGPIGLRISPQIPDYIAAGSYFSLCWVAAVGLAIGTSSWHRIVWAAVSLPLAAALYLTGSRSVVAAALAGFLALALVVVRQRTAAVRAVLAFAAVALIVMAGSYSWMTGRDVAGETAKQSMSIRAELVRTGLRVVETRPLLGVGLDRFYLVAGSLASDSLRAQWQGRMNPHNDLLRFAAELGLLGLGLFLWILLAAGALAWRTLRRTRDPRLAGAVGGLVAFLVTSMVSNPLMVREVSYVFWIALGLAVGGAAGPRPASDVPGGVAPPPIAAWQRWISRLKWPVALFVGALLVVSIPTRARREIGAVDFRRVAYGLSDWRSDDGVKWRWSGPTATLFVDGGARLVEIPVRGTLPSGALQQVEVRVDGQLANRVAVGREWQRVRTLVPQEAASGPRRIDLLISPTWVPAEVLPRNKDDRVLGVRVGEHKVLMPPGQ